MNQDYGAGVPVIVSSGYGEVETTRRFAGKSIALSARALHGAAIDAGAIGAPASRALWYIQSMPPETEDRQQHRMLQKEYGKFYRAVSDILFRHNPMELDGKRNTGDYEAEVDLLLSRIGEANHPGELQELLFDVFLTDFGEENCGGKERYAAAAQEIWKAYERHRQG